MHTPTTLATALADLGITFQTHHHAPLFTVADGASITDHLPGAHVKNLFVEDKTGALTLLTANQESLFSLNAVGRHLQANGRLSFASEQTLLATLGITPGSVTPLALINAKPGAVRFVLDATLPTADQIYAHPLTNTQTLQMAPADLLRAIAHWGHKVEFIDLSLFPKAAN